MEDSHVLNGVMLNKDVTHPGMRRKIENPRILLLDCSLEYQKGESQVRKKIGFCLKWLMVVDAFTLLLQCYFKRYGQLYPTH